MGSHSQGPHPWALASHKAVAPGNTKFIDNCPVTKTGKDKEKGRTGRDGTTRV
jgi:hypothetical protein